MKYVFVPGRRHTVSVSSAELSWLSLIVSLISDFCRLINEICVFLGCDSVYIYLPTFRNNLSVPFSRLFLDFCGPCNFTER